MFSENLINVIYSKIKESGFQGTVYVDPSTLEVLKYGNGIKIFYKDSDSEELNKARVEASLLDFYN